MNRVLASAVLLTLAGAAACSTTSNNANIRGTNTNTGYATNSETNAKPTIPPNSANIEPPSLGNSNSNSGNRNANSNMNTNTRTNTNTNTRP
jgi:hypothetical protein